MLAEPVRGPATSFTIVHRMAAITCDNIDHADHSAIQPTLRSNTSASGRDYGRFSSKGTSATPQSTATKISG